MESLPWNEKYRPNKLKNITYQTETIEIIKHLIKSKSLPHFIFYGPPGTGKTSTILAICNEIFPDKLKSNRIFEFNASSDRGIKFIREKIKKISNLKIIEKKEVIPLKIVILDEVDTLTPESQYALRRIMETSSINTRFCLICNYPNKLIDPIISRCAQFRFKPIPNEKIEKTFKSILKNEGIKNNDKITKIISVNSYGDLRLGISYLERYYKNEENIDSLFGSISNSEQLKMLQYLEDNEYDKFSKLIRYYIDNNYHVLFQIKNLLELISKTNLDDKLKISIINDLTLLDNYVLMGVNNELLWNFLSISLIKNFELC